MKTREPTPQEAAFGAVRAMVAAYVPPLRVRYDRANDYEVVAAKAGGNGETEAFARVHRGADTVTLELSPLGRDPNLLLKVGPALSARRGGTSDFTFSAPDAKLFEDIARLLAACAKPYRSARR